MTDAEKVLLQEEWTATFALTGELSNVPDQFRTSQMYVEAISQNRQILQSVPAEIKTYEFYFKLVTRNCWALENVPENLKTLELCLVAIRDQWETIDYVPDILKSAKLYLATVERFCCVNSENSSENRSDYLSYITFLEQKIENGDNLDLLGIEEVATMSGELVDLLTKGEGRFLRCIPRKLKTKDVCLAAVVEEAMALKFVPEQLRQDEDVCDAAVAKFGGALEYVPECLKTGERCLVAVKNYRGALTYVPEELQEQVKKELDL
jgi:hypothetical protein